jgi:hypothetical protein
MNTPQYIPSFYFYKFAQGISAPYTELAAYSAGAIDSSGNVLKAESSIDSFEYLIIKLKKIFEQLPAGLTKAQLTNYLSTLQLFSEAVQAYDISDAQFAGLVEGYIALNKNPNTSYIALCEDMGVGGGGGGAGTIGTPVVSNNQGGVGGFDPVMAPMQRRKPPVGLDNCEMFDVCAEEMGQFKLAKAWKHLPASETKTYLQRYQARNPKGKIALRSVDPDTGKQDIHWVDYSKQSFAEEYDLGFLDILNEKKNVVDAYTDNNTGSTEIATKTQDEERKLEGQDVHDLFAKHLEKQKLIRVKSPDIKTRKNPDALSAFHASLPHGTFYVGEDADIGHGDDAFVKIDDKIHGGIELKKSKISAARSKKPPKHEMSFGIGKKILDMAAERYGRKPEVAEKPSLVKNAFRGLLKSRQLQKLAQAGAEKEIENKGNLIIAGDFGGVHVLSSARKKENSLYNRHNELAKRIGLSLTGNIRDWGSTQKSGFVESRPNSSSDKGTALKTRVVVSPVPEDHSLRSAYTSNASFLDN